MQHVQQLVLDLIFSVISFNSLFLAASLLSNSICSSISAVIIELPNNCSDTPLFMVFGLVLIRYGFMKSVRVVIRDIMDNVSAIPGTRVFGLFSGFMGFGGLVGGLVLLFFRVIGVDCMLVLLLGVVWGNRVGNGGYDGLGGGVMFVMFFGGIIWFMFVIRPMNLLVLSGLK